MTRTWGLSMIGAMGESRAEMGAVKGSPWLLHAALSETRQGWRQHDQ